jgi:hypothetical protein
MVTRVHSTGADQPASEHEKVLLDERRFLKEANAKRQQQAKSPRPKPQAAWLTKVAKPPKAPKEARAAKEPKEAKAAKAAKDHKPSRADKSAKKAENLDAAKRAAKKSAKA